MKKILLILLCLLLTGCAAVPDAAPPGPDWNTLEKTGALELEYADQFSADYYSGGYTLISIADGNRYLLVSEDAAVPSGLDSDITVLRQPLDRIYLAATSAMDLYRAVDGMDSIRLSSQQAEDWFVEEARLAMERGDILYAGKYNVPDYELLYAEKCDLAVESTMIYHSPEVKEQLERLGIPVLVERSSYEKKPLGRIEWLKLHGLLLGRLPQAEARFRQELEAVTPILNQPSTGKTVAFFSVNPVGYVTVRKSGDYIARAIQMAGGEYIFSDLGDSDNNSPTMNLQMEAFYLGAKDADILIYNSAISGALATLEQLLSQAPLLKDFKAVQTGHVWCTGQNVFQQSMSIGGLLLDFHQVITREDPENLTYLYPLT